ncbi:MAG: GTPase Era [Pseudomonadota bacterium]
MDLMDILMKGAGSSAVGELAKNFNLSGDQTSGLLKQLAPMIAKGVDIPRVLVVNKLDLVRPSHRLLPVIERLTGGAGVQTVEDAQLPGSSASVAEAFYVEVVPVSARSGDNVDTLLDVLLGVLPICRPLFPEDMLTDQAERFLAAEFVREQLMIQTAKEIPYSVAVEVERFVDDPRGKVIEISAVIHVERDSQKGIVIGKRGSRLKEVGQRARQQMEEFFGKRVFLETFVRVQQDWSDDPRSLQRFGYE